MHVVQHTCELNFNLLCECDFQYLVGRSTVLLNVVLLPTPSIPYPHQCKTSPILLSPEHLLFLRKTLAPIHHMLGSLLFQDRDMYHCKVNSMHERLLTGLYSNTMFNNNKGTIVAVIFP